MKPLSKSIFAFFLLFIGVFITSCASDFNQKQSYPKQLNQGFITMEDCDLYYEESGSGIPLIVVHGGPGLDQEYLKPQLLHLAANYRLIFYDQRGSGKSLKTPIDEKHIHIDQFVEDLEALRKSLGLEKFIIMGHSWGGLLAMQYASAHQDHLLGLILVNSVSADYKGQKAFMDEFEVRAKNIRNDLEPLFTYENFKELNAAQISNLYQKAFSIYFYDAKKVEELNLNCNVTSAQSGYKIRKEMMKTSYLNPSINLFPKLKTLDIPTFILHGKQDIVPAWTAEEIKEAIPHAEIVILDHCGHFSYIEKPSQFFTELNKFLSKFSSES